MPVLPPLAAQMGKLRSGERAWLVQGYLARKGLSKRPGRRGGVVPGGLGVKDEVAVRPPERTRPGALREPGGTEPRWTPPGREGNGGSLGGSAPAVHADCGAGGAGGRPGVIRAGGLAQPASLPLTYYPAWRQGSEPLRFLFSEHCCPSVRNDVGAREPEKSGDLPEAAQRESSERPNLPASQPELICGAGGDAARGQGLGPFRRTVTRNGDDCPELPRSPAPPGNPHAGRGRARRAVGQLPARGLGGWVKLRGGAGKALCVAFCPHTPQ